MVNVSINLSPTRQCRSCRFNARSPYLVCAIHPAGPEQWQCFDFESRAPIAQRPSASPPQAPAPEPDWMRFWGPPEDEWLAFWRPGNLGDGDSNSDM
ncbi:DUF6464 family protein [Nodosilinea sp. LEGE 06152]|uniref:DUF6464 family protein n=1 Tax=Nodosilinea sp. LEGE 06152 TaxID=2777966 RepID=UPI001D147E10|nr:DUF6464 family protein [Nodosilinea sp. LEGE 06152]